MDKDCIKRLCRSYETGEMSMKVFMDALEQAGIPYDLVSVVGNLHHKVSYLTNLSKLDEEDQLVAAKWERERDERGQLYYQLSDAEDAGDKLKFKETLDKLCKAPWECEHGRHIVKTCLSCDHIEKTLFPDMFEENEEDEDE